MPASPAVVRKLRALMNRVDEALAIVRLARGREYEKSHFRPADALEWFERWERIRSELVTTDPELTDLPSRPLPERPVSDPAGSEWLLPRHHVERLQKDMRDAWDVLTHPSRDTVQVSLDREGIFVGGQPFDAMVAVTSIVRAATKSVTVVDGYVSEHTLSILSVKADPVAAKVLTLAKSANAALVQHARAFIAQYGASSALEIRTSAAFHDRFIVIDDADCYHFGASIKDAAKKNAFMFSRIEEPTVVADLKSFLAKEWAAATVVAL